MHPEPMGCGAGPVLRPCRTHGSGEHTHLHAAQGHSPARAPGGKQRLLTGTQHMQPKQQCTQRGGEAFTCFPPTVPEQANHGPWCQRLRQRGAEQGARARARRPGSGCTAGTATSHSAGRCGQRARSQVHARPWAPASRASPGPGSCLKGCLPGQGGFAGAGCSLSSAGGCSCDSPACPGGKQAGRASSWPRKRKPSQTREGKRPLSAALAA